MAFTLSMNYRKIKLRSTVVGFGLLVCVAVFAFLFFRKGEYIDIIIKVGEPNFVYDVWRKNPNNGDVYTWFAQLLKIGMEERDGLGRNVAVVSKIFRYDSSPDTSSVYLTTKIKATFSRGSGQYTFKGKPVLIGSEIKLILDRILINGTIVEIINKESTLSTHKIKIQASLFDRLNPYQNTTGVQPYLADAININDTIYDSQNRPIIKVVDKKSTDAQTIVSTSNGQIITQSNPLLKDVVYILEIQTTKIEDKYYFLGNLPIAVGQVFPIHTKTASIYPVITKILKTN
ncbi:DUF4330 family protein [Candidatus Gottesmanbacteria bacterium]|nr:DUF4330 family protein [Candidatus Gottesmanbacteria bacterium]